MILAISFQGMFGILARFINDKRYYISARPLSFRSRSKAPNFPVSNHGKWVVVARFTGPGFN